MNNQKNGIKNNNWLLRIFFFFLAIIGLLFVFIIYIYLANLGASYKIGIDNVFLSTESIKSQERLLAEKSNRPVFGNPKAKLVVVEFGDFQCSVSNKEFPVIREVINKYQNDIYFIYRSYPIINDFSKTLAEASLCANEQGKFWSLHDKLFLNEGKVTADNLNSYVSQAGIEMSKFQNCLKNKSYEAIITSDIEDAIALGVAGTPTFFINGIKMSGALSISDWEKIISEAKKIYK